MKKVILLVFLIPYMVFGQVVDNFESVNAGKWVQSIDGRWKADTTAHINGKYSLYHIFDNSVNATDQVGIPVNNLHPEEGMTNWSFSLRHGYDPSSTNNWAVLLLSDSRPADMIPGNGMNGFAVGVNITGSDDTLRLWKIKGNIITAIVSCHINWQTTIGKLSAAHITVERTPAGRWTISVNRLNGSLIGTVSAVDSELFNHSWFGVFYRYTSSQDRNLWLDDVNINGIFYEDKEAPSVTDCVVTGCKSLDITLNEEPTSDFISIGNFNLDMAGNSCVSVSIKKPLTYSVVFSNPFVNKVQNSLIINSICDKNGNCRYESMNHFTPVWAETGDIIISEIMADPLPEVYLPGCEYFEIENRTGYTFNLKSWSLLSDDQNVVFPDKSIGPYEIKIVCDGDDSLKFKKYGDVVSPDKFISLTDDGRVLCLIDSSGNFIYGVEYSSKWYKNELKKNGGWSLEMVDTDYPFDVNGNWEESVSRSGGTPGTKNSVSGNHPDVSFYGIVNAYPIDSNTITLSFSEPVLNLTDNNNLVSLSDNAISEITSAESFFREFILKTDKPLISGKIYNLVCSEAITDFAGNHMERKNFRFGLSEPAVKGDILFNELLFNPFPGEPDYIELYNKSDKVIDVSELQLVSVDDEKEDTSQLIKISEKPVSFLPFTYYVLTTDKKKVTEQFTSSDPLFIYESDALPAMNDDAGHIVLLNRNLEKIDEVTYYEKMHYQLLTSYEGISLEKSFPEDNSGVAANWHSASESCGWGTPGVVNSLYSALPGTSDQLNLSSSRITPDNDGNEDYLAIQMYLTGIGNVLSISIFDESGNLVKNIVSNMLVSSDAKFLWDATANDGSLVDTGIYIVYISQYNDQGRTKKWKKVCTVIR
jgi:hypothetical protein